MRLIDALRRWVARAVVGRVRDAAWRGQAAFVVATLGLMLFMVRVLAAKWPTKYKISFPDSFSFINAAKHTPFSPSFYVAERPIAFPTLLFLLGRSTVATVVVQTFLYGAVYLFAALIVTRILRQHEARLIGAFLVVTIGLEPRFALWNVHILSESFAMTLAVFSVIAWWRFAAEPTRLRLRWAGFATIAWLTARDSNVPPWMAVGVPALLLASFWWRSATPELRRSLRIWGIATLVVCVGVAVSQSSNGRNRYATMNNVGTRVLDNPTVTDPDEKVDRLEMTAWFVDQGMPLDDALSSRAGFNSFDNNWDMLTSPDLARFRAWADSSGQRAMLLSYIRFAPHWLGNLYGALPLLMGADHAGYDIAFRVADRLPDPAPAQINGPTSRAGLGVWTVLAAAGLVIAAVRRRRVQSVVLGLLLISTFVDLYMAFVGDSVEVQRHMVGPLSRMSLVMVLCLGVGIDAFVEMIRAAFGRSAVSNDDSDEDDGPDGDGAAAAAPSANAEHELAAT